MSVKFSLSLFDDDDLKRVEDMFAKAMTRAIVSALKIAAREGLLRPEAEPEPEPVVAPDVVGTPPPLAPEPPPPEPPRVPVFLRPPPEHPFPNGKAVEPPSPPKFYAKTRALYQQLYKTVADRPLGYITTKEAAEVLGGPQHSGPISSWLQKGELEAVIVAGAKPPSKGLPGRLMISKQSLIARKQRTRKAA